MKLLRVRHIKRNKPQYYHALPNDFQPPQPVRIKDRLKIRDEGVDVVISVRSLSQIRDHLLCTSPKFLVCVDRTSK